ncbi:MAG: TauD/TfdA family dioxygenase [Acidimicrobiia bacterium]
MLAGVRHPPIPVVTTIDDAVGALADRTPAGAVLVRGLDVGDVPPTPSAMEPTTGTTRSERTLLAAAGALGDPVGYAQEHGGRVVQNIYPLAETATEQISTSSDVSLAFHTETAFHPHKPHYLLLLCLRGDPSAATTLCSIDALDPILSDDTRATLAEPRFRIGVDLSFGRGRGWTTDPAPVVTRTDSDVRFTYDGELTVGTDEAATRAGRDLDAAIAAAHTAVVLDAGDLLVVDNHRAVHGRSRFHARCDGSDRWLRRTFVLDSLADVTDRRGNVVTTQFA